ncbi:MAG: M23 family metallopeptidase, partial [Candidatus Aminicenantes bacterium]|nr:M23 family metallopeptidase [Candidatus Aminicenantes bacterium]
IRLLFLSAVLAAAGWFGFVKFEFQKPEIRPADESPYFGRELSFRATDRRSGLSGVRVEAVQAGRTIELFSEEFPEPLPSVVKTIALRPLPAGLTDGDALLRISAEDRSWNGGNRGVYEKQMVIDTRPPRMAVLGGPPSINRGGAGVIAFEVEEGAVLAGVQVGERFFPGFAEGPGRFVVLFALPLDAPRDVPFFGVADDPAGNRTNVAFRPAVKPGVEKKDRIAITDRFLSGVIPYFRNQDPALKGTDLEVFLTVNQAQRLLDYQKLELLCRRSEPRRLWSGPFLRLPKAATMASFGERRSYLYNGNVVDEQVHLGVDLASTARCPVPAANAGRVVFTGPLGIHGETVVLDHGLGLFSMYSHLSRIDAAVPDEVPRGAVLGLSGATGMAGGDHLHFAVLVHGVFVNPVEWWDGHWVRNNIESKLTADGR